ncbi:InlB B-repeat-containing protein [Paenibacillus ferrarius]|uniref:RCC1 domain-containing protein n=1 Tax=Paenibacillus ferrarius TaxID=1469647 RepID=UPI003D2CA1F5
MLNRLNKLIVALVVLLGFIPIAPMKSAHAANYVVAPQLATGYYHSAVLLSDGTVWAWGRNDMSQLSYDTGTYSTWPLQIKNLDHVKQIATSIMSTYAIKEDGTLWAWGLNGNGQLGDGTLTNRTTPVQVRGISGVTAVSTGLGYHVLALKDDGTVWAWGRNDNGELGDGTTTQRQLPVQVVGLTDVVALVNAGYHSLALKSDGTVWAWGRNSYGESGGGISADRTSAYQVSISGVKAIAAGDHHSIAVKDDGTVWTWGRNTYGTIGDGTTATRVTPVQVTGLDHVKSVAAGTHFSYALKEDGTVWSWGYNNYGQLGDGTTTTRLSPVQVSGLTDVVALGGGGYNATAMQSGGEIWAWGYNGYGELGDKTRESRTVPVRNAAVSDLTSPTIVNPDITPTDITETGVTLSWQKATDNLSKQAELEYQVYQIGSRTAATVSAVESSGIRIGTYEPDMDIKQVTDLYDGQSYTFIVMVKDKDGNKSIYNKVTIRTLAIPTFSVTYHTNDGTGTVPTDSNVYYQGETVTALGSGDLSRPGYTFAGWNTQADGNGTTYAVGAAFNIGTADVELYAKWTQNPTYTVTYVVYGGTGAVPIDSNAYEQGTPVTVLGNTGNLARPGYTFAGWNTQKDGNGTTYRAGATFNIGTENVELYAKWTQNPTYTVTYVVYGGTGAVPIDSNAYEQGTPVTVMGNTGNLRNPGYTFAGWNTQKDGNGTAYAAGDIFSIGAENVELYAKWLADPVGDSTDEGDSDTETGNPSAEGNTEKPLETYTGLRVTVDGEDQDLIHDVSISQNRAEMTVYMDADKWQAQLEEKDERPEVVISVAQQVDKVSLVLSGNAAADMANKQGTLIVQTVNGNYKLSMGEIMLGAWAEAFGEQASLTDMVFHIDIAKSRSAQTGKENAAVVGVPVDFNVAISYRSKEIQIKAFNAFVERELLLPEGVSPRTVSTAVRIDADGTIHHVPTRFTTQQGKTVAVVSSLTNSTYALIANSIRFEDVESHWAKDAVNDLGARMVVGGVDEHHFHPDASITRSEFTAILVRALGLADSMSASRTFTDVNEDAWYNGSVAAALSYGLIEGDADGTFHPDRTITREEAITMIYRAMRLAGLDTSLSSSNIQGTLSQFVDGTSVHAWAEQAVAATVASGLIQGSQSELMPGRNMTRAETAAIVYRMLVKANLIDSVHS